MRRVKILTILALALGLTGCGASYGLGIKPADLPANVKQACPDPEALVSQGGTVADDEITIVRLGLELILCEKKRGIAVGGYTDLRDAVSGPR